MKNQIAGVTKMHGTRCASEVAELLLGRIFVHNNYCLKNEKIKCHHTTKFCVMNWWYEKQHFWHLYVCYEYNVVKFIMIRHIIDVLFEGRGTIAKSRRVRAWRSLLQTDDWFHCMHPTVYIPSIISMPLCILVPLYAPHSVYQFHYM